MQEMLVITIGCCIFSLVFAAPQDLASDAEQENTINKEESVTRLYEVSEATEILPNDLIVETPTRGKPTTTDVESISAQQSSGSEKEPTEQAQESPTKKESSTTIEQSSQKPATDPVVEVTTTKAPTTVVTTVWPSTIKPSITTKRPVRKTTAKPQAEENPISIPVTASTPPTPSRQYPCRCGSGTCSCCTGVILENFNVPIRSRACANVTYEPEDFAFNFKLLYNNRVLYRTRMSAKNPRPACIPINRYFGIKMCARLSNVYMSGRNIHACLDMEGYWDDETAFKYSFNCFRIGSNGLAVVHPEDGGGLPPPPVEEQQTDEDYDDSARGWTGDFEKITN